MVRHWARELADPALGAASRRRIRRSQFINGLGAVVTGLVLVIVLATKFAQGAWIVVLAAPLLFALMKAIARHDRAVAEELEPPVSGVTLPARIHAIVLVSGVQAPALRALAYAQATQPATLVAVTAAADDTPDDVERNWKERGVPVPLVVLESPYRETVRPILTYVRQLRREHPGDVISVIIPESVTRRPWANLLHNQTALRLKTRLLFEPSVTMTSVPWVLST